jgi:hypothetical protein
MSLLLKRNYQGGGGGVEAVVAKHTARERWYEMIKEN